MVVGIFYTPYNFNTFMDTFESIEELKNDTAGRDILTAAVIDTERLQGNTYNDKKTALRDQAIEYSLCGNFTIYGSELCELENYFYKYGRRYGLLKEFKNNGIC